MGYYVRALKNKNKLPQWKIQFIDYKNERNEWDIPKERWPFLGFDGAMTLL